MTNYVFVGSEAQGYYSNAYECKGVFVTKDYYETHKAELDNVFNNQYFHELDGKHSEVKGDLLVKYFDDEESLATFAQDIDVSFETYHLLESVEYEEDDEDSVNHEDHVEKVQGEIYALMKMYGSYTYTLTPEENEKVKAFIAELKGAR